MNSRALRVPRRRGETTRRALKDRGLLRTGVRIRAEGEDLLLPIVEGPEVPTDWGSLETAEFVPVPEPPARDYADLLPGRIRGDLPLPRSFDIIGDIVIVRIPDDCPIDSGRIGEALLAFVPGARLVGADRGVHGPDRIRVLDRLAGSGAWATVHSEHGLRLHVDLERAYFSPRLAHEHHRVASEVRPGEVVFDLCCGVGPFAAHIARDRRASRIVAVDSNPDAIELLKRSLAALPAATPVEARTERVEEFLAGTELADRAILNLPHEGIKYLGPLMGRVARGGTIHYYEITPRGRVGDRGKELVSESAVGPSWRCVSVRRIHAYSPQSDLMGYTLERSA
ncbi:MAG: class I SAM-dependent methyltransferase [Thermoplasmata archaeon]